MELSAFTGTFNALIEVLDFVEWVLGHLNYLDGPVKKLRQV